MDKLTSNQTLEIKGKTNSYTKVGWRVGWAVALVGLGIFLYWLWFRHFLTTPMESSGSPATEGDPNYRFVQLAVVLLFFIGAYLPFNRHTYLDLADRQIVTVIHYAWFEISKRCRPLTAFSNIVVRHLCDSRGDGPDTFTGSVGLKPANGGPVLWLKDFPTTQDEVPRAANEFARMLQAMTGLPGAPIESKRQPT